MSRAVRCIECFRHGPVPPHPAAVARARPEVWQRMTDRQRRNNLATFDELEANLPLHIALTGHNDWDHLAPATAEWEHLGPYMGDGYFGADWEAVPADERSTPEEYVQARAWEADPEPLQPGTYCILCGWRSPHHGPICDHIAASGHNLWGSVHAGGFRHVGGPVLKCRGQDCEPPPDGPGLDTWRRIHRLEARDGAV